MSGATVARRLHGSRIRSVGALVALVIALVLLAGAVVIAWRLVWNPPSSGDMGDMRVFVEGGRRLVAGDPIYEYVTENGMGFTYPPFAAGLFSWMPFIDPVALAVVSMLVNLACVGVLGWLVASGALRGRRLGSPRVVLLGAASAVAAAILLQSVPGQANLMFGQINLVLAVMCLVDAGEFVPPRYRGVVVGIATAIKLTPGVFIIYFLVSRQWRAAITSSISAIACTLIGFVIAPGDSWTYWTSALWQTDRVGHLDGPGNHSILGVMARSVDEPSRAVWVVIVIVVFAGSLWLAARRRKSSPASAVVAVAIVGCASTLMSPITWIHHEIWLTLLAIAVSLTGPWSARIVGVLAIVMYVQWGTIVALFDLDAWWRGALPVFAAFVLVTVAGLTPLRRQATERVRADNLAATAPAGARQ